MLIDTHTHLYAEQFDSDRIEMIARALKDGINRFYLPNIDSESISGMLELEKVYPGICFPMMGLHPCSVKENYKEELSIVKNWLDKREFSAVGEIGMDLFWDTSTIDWQADAFRTQINWAKELGIPIVIHSREATEPILKIVDEEKDERLRGVFHCFTGTSEQAEKIMDLGFFLGIGGVLTFRNSGLDEVIKEIPLESLVLETDSPYLAPVPFRGKRNESAHLLFIAQKLALIKNVELKEIEEITSLNALKLFGSN